MPERKRDEREQLTDTEQDESRSRTLFELLLIIFRQSEIVAIICRCLNVTFLRVRSLENQTKVSERAREKATAKRKKKRWNRTQKETVPGTKQKIPRGERQTKMFRKKPLSGRTIWRK